MKRRQMKNNTRCLFFFVLGASSSVLFQYFTPLIYAHDTGEHNLYNLPNKVSESRALSTQTEKLWQMQDRAYTQDKNSNPYTTFEYFGAEEDNMFNFGQPAWNQKAESKCKPCRCRLVKVTRTEGMELGPSYTCVAE